MKKIPCWRKYMLTLREAAEYFHIGEKKLREMVDENIDSDFIMIKRKRFEKYLDEVSAI